MKSRVKPNLMIALMVAAVLGTASAFAQNEPAKPAPSLWEQMTQKAAVVRTQVKVTVKKWYDYYWAGQKAPASVEPQQPTQVGSQPGTPTGQPGQAASQPGNAPTGPGVATSQPYKAPARPKPEETEEQAQMRETPIFQEEGQSSNLEDVKALRESIKKTPLLTVAEPGRAGTSVLPKTKAGVPAFDFKTAQRLKPSARKIPRLDIGRENRVSGLDFQYGNLSWALQKPSELKPLPQVPTLKDSEIQLALGIKPLPAKGPRQLEAKVRPVGSPVNQETIDKITYKLEVGQEAKPLPYKPVADETLKMVAALMLFEKGDQCHMIMGMFHQLSKAPATRAEAEFHLGSCAAQLGMQQAAFEHLSTLVEAEDKDFGPQALEAMAKNLPIIYEKEFYKLMKGVRQPAKMITEAAKDFVSYRMAKGAYRSGDYKTASGYAAQVSEKSEYYDEARFLSAMNSWAQGDRNSALKKLEALHQSLEARKVQASNIRAVTNVNLARMYFAQKKYPKAHEHYMQVPKDHPLWVQALIEQGWTQLALEDFSGAIGNMYSLHSPYFKAVYQPESFVVRTIGYINICQYGDAYKSLSFLEKDYRDWSTKMNGYMTTGKVTADSMYNNVKTYIRGKSDENLHGVPYQIWREMARRKDFLNLQAALNEKLDETKRYEGVNEKIKEEKAGIRFRAAQSKRRFDEWKTKIASVKKDRSLAKNLQEWQASLKLEKDITIGHRFRLAILEVSRQGYLDFQKRSQAQLDKETVRLSARAGENLLKRAQGIKEEMARVLDNNELLRYEVFSGSGENIRYQVAGGQVAGANRVPAHIKPVKMMNWSFDGEFWEDEIGSYRSSLQNNCPRTDQANLSGH